MAVISFYAADRRKRTAPCAQYAAAVVPRRPTAAGWRCAPVPAVATRQTKSGHVVIAMAHASVQESLWGRSPCQYKGEYSLAEPTQRTSNR